MNCGYVSGDEDFTNMEHVFILLDDSEDESCQMQN
jgi:hypothetical protein